MVPQAGDMLIMDATSDIDRSDTKLFHLMSPSAIGGLPLGTLVVTREDEKTIYHAMKFYQDNLPLNAFHGRGPKLGPALGMTDDCPAKRNTLRRMWPELVAMLCHFHILQVAMYFDYIDYIHHSPNPQKPKILQFKVEDNVWLDLPSGWIFLLAGPSLWLDFPFGWTFPLAGTSFRLDLPSAWNFTLSGVCQLLVNSVN